MSTTTTLILVVLVNNPQQSYNGFVPHPNILIKSTSILHVMEEDEFEWNQVWVNLYWPEVDVLIMIYKEE